MCVCVDIHAEKTIHLVRTGKMEKLPNDITADILSRLPVKSLMQFKCVSKPWRSLISSSKFAQLHLKRSKQDTITNPYKLLITTFPRQSIVDHEASSHDSNKELEAISELEYPIRVPDLEAEVAGSCDGLVCLVVDYDNFILWNPTTRKSMELPKLNLSPDQGTSFFGIGHDFSLDDYKVVRGVSFESSDGSKETRIEVLTLKSKTWRSMTQHHSSGYTYTMMEGPSVSLNGALHWLERPGNNQNEPLQIFSFDLGEEKFIDFVPFPDNFIDETILYLNMGSLGDSLYLHCYRSGECFEMWVMKDYRVKESWSRVFCISCPSERLPLYEYWVTTVCFTKNGKLVLEVDGRELVMYDGEEQGFKNFRLNAEWDWFHVVRFQESLVSPCGCDDNVDS